MIRTALRKMSHGQVCLYTFGHIAAVITSQSSEKMPTTSFRVKRCVESLPCSNETKPANVSFEYKQQLQADVLFMCA